MVNLYNISIPDSSPTFTYSPFREVGDVASGWKSFYTGSPDEGYDNTFQSTNRGSGTSSHSTSMQGAAFELSFVGTGVYVYGTGSAGAFTTSLDDGTALDGSPKDGILASYANLEYKTHKLRLTLTQSQSLSLSSALVTVGVGKTGAMVTDKKVDAINVNPDETSSLNTNFFSTSGSGFNTRGKNDPLAYPRVDTNSAGSSIIIRFNSASAIRVYGAIYHDHGTFTAALSPSAGASSSSRTFNATSKWFASDVLIYWESGLDRAQSYTLTLTNGDQNKYLDVNSIVLMDGQGGIDETATAGSPTSSTLFNGSPTSISPSSTSDTGATTHTSSRSSSLSTGAIIGIAVGGGIAAITIFVLILLLCRRRRRKAKRVYNPNRMVKEIPPSPNVIEPFIYRQATPTPSAPNSPIHSRFNSFVDTNSSYYPPKQSYGDSSSLLPPHVPPWVDMGASGSNTLSSQSSRISEKQRELTGSRPNTSGTVSGGSESASASGSGVNIAQSEIRTPSVRRETDAGPLPQPEESEPEEIVLPPGYDPTWSTGR